MTWLVIDLFGIEDNFVELSGFSKTLDDLVWNIATQIDAQSKSCVMWLDHVTEFLATIQLSFIDPLFNQLLSSLEN
jgi:hypothetical protein